MLKITKATSIWLLSLDLNQDKVGRSRGGLHMYAFNCSSCGERWVIFESQVTAIRNDKTGIHVSVTCWCGAPGEIHTGHAHTGREPELLVA
jgi:hypothetical protein